MFMRFWEVVDNVQNFKIPEFGYCDNTREAYFDYFDTPHLLP